MKRYLIIFLLLTFNVNGQLAIESNFNRNATANSQNVMLNYAHKKWTVGLGSKYLFNKNVNFPLSVVYKRTYWALNTNQRFGLEVAVMYKIWDLPRVDFNVYYDFQFTKSAMRFKMFWAYEELVSQPQSEFDYTYVKEDRYIQPVFGYEQNIGINMTFDLTKNVYFTQKAGVGVLLYNEKDPTITLVGAGNWVFSEMYCVGIGFRFLKTAPIEKEQ